MTYKSYPKANDTPSRLTRKQSRRTVFVYNSKLSKLTRRPRLQVAPGGR